MPIFGCRICARKLHSAGVKAKCMTPAGSLCRSNSQSRKMSWSVSTERKWPATVASVFVTGQVTPCSHSTTLYATLYDDADRTGFLVGPRSNFQSLPGPLLVRVGQLSCLCPAEGVCSRHLVGQLRCRGPKDYAVLKARQRWPN